MRVYAHIVTFYEESQYGGHTPQLASVYTK